MEHALQSNHNKLLNTLPSTSNNHSHSIYHDNLLHSSPLNSINQSLSTSSHALFASLLPHLINPTGEKLIPQQLLQVQQFLHQQLQQQLLQQQQQLLATMLLTQLGQELPTPLPSTSPRIDLDDAFKEMLGDWTSGQRQYNYLGPFEHNCSKKDKAGGAYLTDTFLKLPTLPPPDIPPPAGDSHLTRSNTPSQRKQPCLLPSTTEDQYNFATPSRQRTSSTTATSAATSLVLNGFQPYSKKLQQQETLLNFQVLRSMEIEELTSVAVKHFDGLVKPQQDGNDQCASAAAIPTFLSAARQAESYLRSLKLNVDVCDEENFSLFFAKKLKISLPVQATVSVSSEEETTATASEGEDHVSSLQLENNNCNGGTSSTFLQQDTCGASVNSCVQEKFVDARRNKKRAARIEKTLKGEVAMSMKFHNLTRLLMYKIMRVFSQSSSSDIFTGFDVSRQFSSHLLRVVQRVKQHSRDTCKNAVKTNFYTHSHYNALFLVLTPSNLAQLTKHKKDVEAHQFIFGLDISNPDHIDSVQLVHANIIKQVAFKIVQSNLHSAGIFEGGELFLQPVNSKRVKEVLLKEAVPSTISQKEALENHQSNLRALYFKRAFQGIQKMNAGIIVNRF